MKTVIDQGSGIQTVIALEDGNLITGTVQDYEYSLEYTKRLHNEGMHGGKDIKLAARLEPLAVETYMNLNGLTFEEFMRDPKHVRAMCNDPALKSMRVWPGRV